MRFLAQVISFVFMMSVSIFAYAAELSETHKKGLEAAFKTKNDFVLKATVNAIANENASLKEQAYTYLANIEQAPKIAALKEKTRLAQLPWYHPDLWEGEVSVGLDLQRGNTNQQKLDTALSVKRETKKWFTKIKLEQHTTEEDKVKTEDEFKANFEGRYKLDDAHFIFGEADFERDPFSGYNYKLSESLGYGYTTTLSEKAKLDSKISLGLRHSEIEETGEMEHEAIIKPALAYRRKLRDNVDFEQLLSSTMGSEFILTESTSAIKTQIFDNLYFKVVVDIDHNSSVPEGSKQTDIQNLLQIVYGF